MAPRVEPAPAETDAPELLRFLRLLIAYFTEGSLGQKTEKCLEALG